MSAELDCIVQPRAGETAADYAQSAVAGRIVTGKFVQLACERFLTDLQTGESRGFYFDAEAAQHAIDFFGFLRHTKGIWAKKPETAGFLLQPWQVFILANLFGWRRFDTGARRFREAHIELARKNGKSTFVAGIGLYMMLADGEPGADIYSAACTKEQARIVFRAAKDMTKVSPFLNSRIGIWQNNLHVDLTTSKFEPLASDSNLLDGLHIHCALIDELHEHPDRTLYDVLNTGTGSRQQPLICAITTAGHDREGICWAQRTFGIKILSKKVPDDDFLTRVNNPSFFAFIATLDDGDDPWDEKNWAKANPNLGISISLDALRPGAVKAKEDPTSTNEFLRKHLNCWTSQDTAWLAAGVWEKNCKVGEFGNAAELRKQALEKLKGRRCFGGLDLAEVEDVNAFVLVFPPCELVEGIEVEAGFRCVYVNGTKETKLLPEANAKALIGSGAAIEKFGMDIPEKLRKSVVRQEADTKWHILPWFWIPKAHVDRRVKAGRAPYDVWIREGFIEATDGDSVNQEGIRNTILEVEKPFRCGEIGYDKWGMEWLGPKLLADGLKVVAIPQMFEFLSAPTKQLTSFLGDQKVEHYNNPVLRWMASNVQLLLDSNGNCRPNKGKSSGKIDGVVAAVMALGRALANPIVKGADRDDRFKISFI